MLASVRFKLPDGEEAELVSGEIIGRAWTCALRLDDGRVSEAHAMVSLRGGELRLLALRGVFAVDGERRTQVVLEPGLRVHLADGLALEVVDVELPDAVLAIEGPGLARTVLSGVCSLVFDPRPTLEPGYVRQSALRLWPGPDGWTAEVDGRSRPVAAGDALQLAGGAWQIVAVDLRLAEARATRRDAGLRAPLHIVARFDSVHLHRPARPAVVLSGIPARLVTELVLVAGPLSWDVLARELWPQVDDRNVRRRRLDLTLSRLRRRLQEHGIRPDLIRSDHTGQVELVLDADDRAEDAS